MLKVQGLSMPKQDQFGTDLHDIALEVRAGEIVGVAGVSGNGQQEFMAALSGEDPRAPAGSIAVFGSDVSRAPPRARRQLGLHFVPEERLGRGAVPTLSLAQNTLLTRTENVGRAGWLRTAAVEALAASLIERFKVKAGGPGAAARSLSGGNLQKFIVGREIDANPKLLIVSQPTWGVDVGAAAQIRGELLALRDAGCARAGGQRRARRAVRDQRSSGGDRARAPEPERADREGDDRDDRRVDERAVAATARGGWKGAHA